jgi:hypothetical protein
VCVGVGTSESPPNEAMCGKNTEDETGKNERLVPKFKVKSNLQCENGKRPFISNYRIVFL